MGCRRVSQICSQMIGRGRTNQEKYPVAAEVKVATCKRVQNSVNVV